MTNYNQPINQSINAEPMKQQYRQYVSFRNTFVTKYGRNNLLQRIALFIKMHTIIAKFIAIIKDINSLTSQFLSKGSMLGVYFLPL
jgi:uncharacterized protein YutE (UPF0331/DUF86 family)